MSHYLTHSWHIQLDVIHVEEVVRGHIHIHSGGELVQGVECSDVFHSPIEFLSVSQSLDVFVKYHTPYFVYGQCACDSV